MTHPLPPAPPRSIARVATAATLLAVIVAVVLAMTLSPTPLDRGYSGSIARVLAVLHRNGIPSWFGYSALEFTANIAMFVPVGFLTGMLLPRRALWVAIPLLPAFSATIELAQRMFLAERFATVGDVIANTVGGMIGLVAIWVLRLFMAGRDRKIVARALWERDVRHARDAA